MSKARQHEIHPSAGEGMSCRNDMLPPYWRALIGGSLDRRCLPALPERPLTWAQVTDSLQKICGDKPKSLKNRPLQKWLNAFCNDLATYRPPKGNRGWRADSVVPFPTQPTRPVQKSKAQMAPKPTQKKRDPASQTLRNLVDKILVKRGQNIPAVFADGVDVRSSEFLQTAAWRRVRYPVLVKYGRQCQCCGQGPEHGVVINVDHIKPRKHFPELALNPNNLQILCEDCNHGKGNIDDTDFR